MTITWRSVCLGIGLASCANTPRTAIPVAFLVDGDPRTIGPIAAHAVDGIELRPISIPPPPAVAVEPSPSQIALARAAYTHGELENCRAELAHVDLTHLIATDRTLAARAMTLDVACAWGGVDRASATDTAERMASMGLELSQDRVPPDVEQLIGDAVTRAGTAPRTMIAVTGIIDARLSVDGHPSCALPCTVDAPPGDHVLSVDADGFVPALRLVRTPATTTIAIDQQVASPALAGAQWRARLARGLPATDGIGAMLVGRLASDRRIIVAHGSTQLTGALVVDGRRVAETERDRDDGTGLVRELAYESKLLPRPTIWQRPTVWIAASAAVLVVSGVVLAIALRGTQTELGL